MAMFSPQVVERIRAHYRGGDLAVGDLLDLLQFRVSPPAERASQVLARMLCLHEHTNRIEFTAGAGNVMPLYTVTVDGHAYRVQLDGRNWASAIMDAANVDLACSEPSVATGAVAVAAPTATSGRGRAASRASRR